MVKKIAKESLKTKKIRKRLEDRCVVWDRLATDDLRRKKVEEIKERIYRFSFQRKLIKHKKFALFDENTNSKELSEKVSMICRRIEKGFF